MLELALGTSQWSLRGRRVGLCLISSLISFDSCSPRNKFLGGADSGHLRVAVKHALVVDQSKRQTTSGDQLPAFRLCALVNLRFGLVIVREFRPMVGATPRFDLDNKPQDSV